MQSPGGTFTLVTNIHTPVVAGIELGSGARLRLLAQALTNNTSCTGLDLSRKGLNDEGTIIIWGKCFALCSVAEVAH